MKTKILIPIVIVLFYTLLTVFTYKVVILLIQSTVQPQTYMESNQ